MRPYGEEMAVGIMAVVLLWLLIVIAAICIHVFIALQFKAAARDKGYDGARYFIIPFFFGFVGYILVAALPDRGRKSGERPNVPGVQESSPQ